MTDSPDDGADDGPEFSLVMPFVACRSKGGPYDDESFVAGWRCAVIDLTLRMRDLAYIEDITLASLVDQLDLVAMQHGYTMVARPAGQGHDEWAHLAFTRVDR